MNKMMLLTCTLLVAGCATKANKPAALTMKNPAAVYCVEQGGKRETVSTAQGQTAFCTLPSGERVDEWTLYRRDHK